MMGAQLSNRNFDQTVVYIERATWKYYNICTENEFWLKVGLPIMQFLVV